MAKKSSNLNNIIKRSLIMLLIVGIYVMGTHITLPFVEITARYKAMMTDTPLSIMSIISGANFSRLSIFSIGLNPFMIAMLILQLLTMTKLFGFDALSMDQVQIVQQFIILILTIAQSIFFTTSMIPERNLYRDFAVIIILVAGSLLVIWLCFMNIKFGIGGSSPIILVNITGSVFPTLIKVWQDLVGVPHAFWWILLSILIALGAIVFWIAFSHAYYPLKTINTSLPSYADPIIVPIGLNMGAMMTYMIGMAVLVLPTMLSQYFGPDSLINNVKFDAVFSFVLAIALFYFFTFMQFEPKEQAKRLRDANNYVLNIRPGKPTQKYLTRVLIGVALPGALINATLLALGLFGSKLLGRYAGVTMIPMNVVMLTMFISGIQDQVAKMLYPYLYERLMKEE